MTAGSWTGGGGDKQELDSCPDVSAHAQRHACLPNIQGAQGFRRGRGRGGILALLLHLKHTACQFSILMLWYDRRCLRAAVLRARLLRLLDPKWSFPKEEKIFPASLCTNDAYCCLQNRRGGRCEMRCGAERQRASQNRPGVRPTSVLGAGSSICWSSLWKTVVSRQVCV